MPPLVIRILFIYSDPYSKLCLTCSDDACKYGYLVPANMFASATLGYVVEMATKLWNNDDLAKAANKLKLDIDEGIKVRFLATFLFSFFSFFFYLQMSMFL
jgi:hypothetical protein